ncbi:MAG TPA: SDR family oxidoreductase [Kiloniellaceae bacterium]|nr:SDR family oxidoreductase [Kiloniellaceae bacterium]
MAGRLVGKTALVTAAAQGMGRAAAAAMAREGAKVFATDVNEAGLASLAAEQAGIETFRLDVTAAEEIAAAPARTGPLEVLFNCAGFVHNGTILDATEDDFDFAFTLNVRSQFRLIRAYLPGMLEAGGGSIINMSSVASVIKGAPNRCLYSATKAAVLGLTKTVARDFVDRGIRCNAICPGTILTPSLEERMRASGDFEQAKKDFLARQPIGRFATAEEVTGIVVHLASDESRFTTGTMNIVDGGWAL